MTEKKKVDGKLWAAGRVRCRQCGGHSDYKHDHEKSYQQCRNKACGATWQYRWKREGG